MKNLTLSLAWKYIRFKKKDKNISLMMKICFFGILIGTFALMLSLIITNGFEKTIHEKLQGISAQIIIKYPNKKLDAENLRTMLKQEFNKEIKDCSGSSLGQIIIDKDKKQGLIIIKGIEPQFEGNVTNLTSKIIWGNKDIKESLQNNQIIIGHKIAESFNLKIGDTISLLIPESGSKTKIYLSKINATISGIFKVGIDDYDASLAFCSLNFFNSTFDQKGVDQIAIKLNEPCNQFKLLSLFSFSFYKNIFKRFFSKQSFEEKVIQEIKKRLSPAFDIYSWKDLYPALVSSLKLEKYGMFFILALITLVASLNMISLLFILIQQKRRDIAIFKAMGMNDRKIQNIFLLIGMTITFFATSLGLGLAALAGFLIEKYPFIELPDVYFVSHLPARMDPEIFIVVFLCTILLGFFATWIPAKRTKNINITEVLRME